MRNAIQRSRPFRTQAPSVTYTVKFPNGQEKRPRAPQEPPVGRIPRVTRLLALAHRIDGMIRSGEIRGWAEAARLVGVTRARMTQIANLLLLAPEIQEAILMLSPLHSGNDSITERNLRAVGAHADWREQDIVWMPLRQRSNIALPA